MAVSTMKSLFIFVAFLSVTWAMPAKRIETDPELTSGHVEGDMVIDMKLRNGLRNPAQKWPNNTVYYKFFAEFDESHTEYVLRGMNILESVSCIRFKEATPDIKNYINITSFDDGCYSSVGFLNNGSQTYNLKMYSLNTGCFRLGTIIHELLHTLGFFHMQSASNRDDYVLIIEENIQKGKESNFNKYNETIVDLFGEEYDYGSILHYSAYAFSKNGEITIKPVKDPAAIDTMGQRLGMSESDIKKLNAMYSCDIAV